MMNNERLQSEHSYTFSARYCFPAKCCSMRTLFRASGMSTNALSPLGPFTTLHWSGSTLVLLSVHKDWQHMSHRITADEV